MSASSKPRVTREVIREGGVRSINFFNGRLLTGEDLTDEQGANLTRQGRLGQILGAGVVGGLQIAPVAGQLAVTVSAGTAVNTAGQTLRLDAPIVLSLRAESAVNPVLVGPVKDFRDAEPLEKGLEDAGDGVYLLTVAPAGTVEERVPTYGLGNLTAPCAARYRVDALQFRFFSLVAAVGELPSARLRSLVAAYAFGVTAAPDFVTDPFSNPAPAPRLLDRLPGKIPPDDVPLAIFRWTAADGITFLDPWTVRRRLAGPPDELLWSPALGPRALAEAEAMFFQFQDQITDLAASTPESIVAADHLAYLPPAGVLPLAGTPGFSGFVPATFFQGLTIRDPIFIEGARVPALLREALRYPPTLLPDRTKIPVVVPDPTMIWIYHVRENAYRADGHAGARVQPYAVFTSGQVPYAGEARFDVGRWDYATFS